jgi:hypothetical protein
MTEKKRKPQTRENAKAAQRVKPELSVASGWQVIDGSANAELIITTCFNYIFFVYFFAPLRRRF